MNPFVILKVDINTVEDFLLEFTQALKNCHPPQRWSVNLWVSQVIKEYGLDSDNENDIKYHLRYLAHYFTNPEYDKRIKTILIEKNYLSMTFFNDYKNFYSSIVSQYGSLCSRIHFFSCEFDEEYFAEVLNSKKIFSNLCHDDDYLGCVVIRPLHKHIVGTTFLRPYPEATEVLKSKRFYPTVRDYKIDLFGIILPIKTLAFTSQDKAVGACASFALWISFNKTYKIFKTRLPTPSEITRQAGKPYNVRYRSFPNKGLDVRQIGNVIEYIGLEPEFRKIDSKDKSSYGIWLNDETKLVTEKPHENKRAIQVIDVDLVKAYIYAYSRLGIPVLLGLGFKEGDHLIAVSGYRELTEPEQDREKFKAMLDERLLWKSRRIERFFCHDDNIGAFSRLFFCEKLEDMQTGLYGTIITSWPSSGVDENFHNVLDVVRTNKMRRRAELKYICVPIEETIRLNFEDVHEKISYVDKIFDIVNKEFLSYDNSTQTSEESKSVASLVELCYLEWDVYLTMSKEYKTEILSSVEDIHNDFRVNILSTIMPRYVWVARGRTYENGQWKVKAEIVFDSTESPTSYPCKVFLFEKEVYKLLAYFFILLQKAQKEPSLGRLTMQVFTDQHLRKLIEPKIVDQYFLDPITDIILSIGKQNHPKTI